jgi:hypothetical protein
MRKIDLLRQMKWIATTLFLNDIEISVWSLYLDSAVWKTANTTTIAEELMYAGFAAKSLSQPSVESIKYYLTHNYESNFLRRYNDWLQNKQGLLGATIKSVNTRFAQLTSNKI